MSKSVKAVLLSGLLFPGLGHLYLKAYGRGVGLVTVSIGAFVGIIDIALARAQAIADKVLSGEVAMDAAAIAAQVSRSSTGAGEVLVQVCVWAFFGCWIVGIVDSYRVGQRMQQSDHGVKP